MNELQLPRSASREFDNKELYRAMFSTPLRNEVQPNAGRIQQVGKESYCVAYSSSQHQYYGRVFGRYSVANAAEITNPFKHLKCAYDLLCAGISGAYFIPDEISDTDNLHVIRWGGRMVPIGSRSKERGFVGFANRLAQAGHIDAALDLIYDRVDNLLSTGRFHDLDSILGKISLSNLTVDVLLGLLTSTLPGKTKLRFRTVFFHKVEEEIKKRGEWENGLLAGLEN